MTRAALAKAEKQWARYGTQALQTQVEALKQALATAEQALQESL